MECEPQDPPHPFWDNENVWCVMLVVAGALGGVCACYVHRYLNGGHGGYSLIVTGFINAIIAVVVVKFMKPRT